MSDFKRRRLHKSKGASNYFFKISAKDNTGVYECYDYILSKIINVNSYKANKLKKKMYLDDKK